MLSSKCLLENTSYFSFTSTRKKELVKELSTWSTEMPKNLRFTLFQKKIGGEDPTAGDAVAIIAVRGKGRKCPIRGRGVFKILDASEITEVDSSISIGEIVMADLLPKNLDYYYEGSLTTPDCDETVQWFCSEANELCANSILGTIEEY